MNTKEKIEQLSIKSGIPIKEINKLNCDRWFHGTTSENADNIIECGVIADYNIGSSLYLIIDCTMYITTSHMDMTSYGEL